MGWWHCQAVQPPWHGLAVFVFWHNGPELPRVSGEHEGSALQVWDGLRVSPRTAPSKRAKLCTYFAWFLRPSQLKTVPFFELPMPISRVQLLMHFRMGSHASPVEQGWLAKPAVPRHLRRCTLCRTRACGDERHFVFDCPHFAHIRRQFGRCIKMLMVPCSVLCGTRTRKLFAIALRPSSIWLTTPIKTRPQRERERISLVHSASIGL